MSEVFIAIINKLGSGGSIMSVLSIAILFVIYAIVNHFIAERKAEKDLARDKELKKTEFELAKKAAEEKSKNNIKLEKKPYICGRCLFKHRTHMLMEVYDRYSEIIKSNFSSIYRNTCTEKIKNLSNEKCPFCSSSNSLEKELADFDIFNMVIFDNEIAEHVKSNYVKDCEVFDPAASLTDKEDFIIDRTEHLSNQIVSTMSKLYRKGYAFTPSLVEFIKMAENFVSEDDFKRILKNMFNEMYDVAKKYKNPAYVDDLFEKDIISQIIGSSPNILDMKL